MKRDKFRSDITKTLGSDFMELLTEVSPLIGPRVDVLRTNQSLIITADLAGARPEEVKLGLTAGALVISGAIHPAFDKTNAKIIQQERYYGQFKKTIPLPKNCVTKPIRAEMESGILTIDIPFSSDPNTSGEENSHDDHSL
ncbi:Hsp20/alpha crystallin family protein [Neobacillus notoginsengisoli]|uniref:Hsp20/alpha crystallin family protein n=1 Tax=Neobacillus notoginsengisoli TaxID=1578198 RepID=A0A417YWD5_9BACI|nr:Hsp20/alpha crystallin family protein [Neobacillus notoginsengisoli]RHW41634.1 Hsp20/alpha crystallin family protein [Neobacillus notoginsengisoli]